MVDRLEGGEAVAVLPHHLEGEEGEEAVEEAWFSISPSVARGRSGNEESRRGRGGSECRCSNSFDGFVGWWVGSWRLSMCRWCRW